MHDLSEAIHAEFGGRTRDATAGILKRLSPIPSTRRLADLISEYVDEETKRRVIASELGSHTGPAIVAGHGPQRPGIDFQPSDQSGIRVFGFLREALPEAEQHRVGIKNPKSLHQLGRWWGQRVGARKRCGYHLVFSADPRITARAGELGYSMDAVLHSSAAEALLAFNHRFYPGQSLSWISGIHHDRHHIHAHVLLYPQTDAFRPLNLSDRSAVTHQVDGEPMRINFLSFLRGAYLSDLALRLRATREVVPAALQAQVGKTHALYRCLIDSDFAGGDIPGGRTFAEAWYRRCGDLDFHRRALEFREKSQGCPPPLSESLLAQMLAAMKIATERLREIRTKTFSAVREKLLGGLSRLDNGRLVYPEIQYTPGSRSIPPSGTLSYLGLPPSPTGQRVIGSPNQLNALIAQRWAQIDSVLDALPDADTTTEIDQYRSETLVISSRIMVPTLETMHAHSPSLCYSTPEFVAAGLADDPPLNSEQTKERVRILANQAARRRRKLHRTATLEDLELEHIRTMNRRRIAQFSDDEIDADFEIPTAPVAHELDPVANYIERESAKAGVRTLQDLLNETDPAVERLKTIVGALRLSLVRDEGR